MPSSDVRSSDTSARNAQGKKISESSHVQIFAVLYLAVLIFAWFLLGTGRMPHPVGGDMGVTLYTAAKRGQTRFDIISLNIYKTTSR